MKLSILSLLMITLAAIGIMNSSISSAQDAPGTISKADGLKAATPALAKPPELKAPGFQSKMSFSGLKLQGQLKKPDLSYIYKRRGLKAEQIVNIPEDFNEEIVQGAGRF